MIHFEYTFHILGGQREMGWPNIKKEKIYIFFEEVKKKRLLLPTNQEWDSLLLQGQRARHLPLIFASPCQDMW